MGGELVVGNRAIALVIHICVAALRLGVYHLCRRRGWYASLRNARPEDGLLVGRQRVSSDARAVCYLASMANGAALVLETRARGSAATWRLLGHRLRGKRTCITCGESITEGDLAYE